MRRLVSPILALAALASPMLALAQPMPPANSPAARTPAARQAELDRLFEALKTAPDESGGAAVEARIRALWGQQASPAAALLLRRGLRNLEGNAADEAVEDFDAALTLQADFAEAWVMRAESLGRLGDAAAAARDLQEALRLEPRHFGALLALSALQEERGDLMGALRSQEAALAIHPKLAGGAQRLNDLRRRALGDDT